MMKRLVLGAAAGAFAMGMAGTASAEWSRSYIIEWYEPAFYYDGDGGVTDPGTDCPNGPNPEPDWEQVLVDAGYTRQEAQWLRDPSHPFRIPNHGQNQMAFRGEERQNVYIHPESYPDPGLVQVSGNIGEGLNLDGDATNGFTSPDGQTGIDNEFYRTVGCWMTYRGPARTSGTAQSRNDEMRGGSWTVAIVVTGEGDDPMNDPNVRVGLYNSEDPMVKDANGNIVRDATFRVAPDSRLEGLFDARTENGVIIADNPVEEIWVRDPSYTRELQLLQAQLRLTMHEDGSLDGLLAGYRPWMDVYDGWVDARGSVIEQLTWVELPGVYYALKRNADYAPEPGGERTHISFAMRIDAVPAFVIAPDATAQVAEVTSYIDEAPEVRTERLDAVSFQRLVVDGIVRSGGGIPGGPDVDIPPPTIIISASAANESDR